MPVGAFGLAFNRAIPATTHVETADAAQLNLSGQTPGVTIEQLVGMFAWEPHTARAAISVASKRLGIKVERDERPAHTDCQHHRPKADFLITSAPA